MENIVKEFINEDWNWGWKYGDSVYSKGGFSKDPCITTEFIEKFIDKPWNWRDLSSNSNVTMEFVEKFLDKPWDWGWLGLSSNPNVTIEFIEKYIDKHWDWMLLVHHGHITMDFISNNKPMWLSNTTLYNLSEYVPLDFIENHIHLNWDWGNNGLSRNKNVTNEFIEKYIDKPWSWGSYDNGFGCGGLSMNKNLTLDFIKKYIDKPWSWHFLTDNPNLTIEFINKYANDDVYKQDFILKHLNQPSIMNMDFNLIHFDDAHLKVLSRIAPIKIIEKFIKQNLDWGSLGLSSNKAITMEFVEKHIDKPWHWEQNGLSTNPNITLSFLRKYKNKRLLKQTWIQYVMQLITQKFYK